MFNNELLFVGYYYVGGKMLVPDWSSKQTKTYSGGGITLEQDSFVILAFITHGETWNGSSTWNDYTTINGQSPIDNKNLEGLNQPNAPCMLFLPKGTTIGSRTDAYGGTALVYKAVEYS